MVRVASFAALLTIASSALPPWQSVLDRVSGSALASMSIVSDHRYRASGAVRPFLLFWITRDNVGGARITRRRGGDGSIALEMLTGSDPARAPFRTNRWGYIREIVRGDQAELVALKTETDEETIEQAKANVSNTNARGALVFIREQVTQHEAVAWSAVAEVGRDVSFRDLDYVLNRFPEIRNWQERRLVRPPGTRPGFLTAFTEMMDSTAQLWASGARPKANAPRRLTYVHRAELFDLHQDQIERLTDVPAGAGDHVRALRARFRIWNRQTNQWSGDFVAVYGVDGALAGVPLRLTYQPRWWLRTELAIDETASYSADQ